MRGWRAQKDNREDGFTILEIVVAVGILFVALVAMAHAATVALIDVGHARQRQAATGLANQVIEQVRALPAATVRLGLSAPDLATDTDPRITRTTTGGITRYLYNGEELLTHTPAVGTTSPPLVPHRVRSEPVARTRYWVAVYTTLLPDGDTVRVTADVSWVDPVRPGTTARVAAQTLFSSGIGCGDSATVNPYGAPCAANLVAEAFVDKPTVTIRANNPASSFQEATLTLPHAYSKLTAGQVTEVHSVASTSGATFTILLNPDTPQTAGVAAADVTVTPVPAVAGDLPIPYIKQQTATQGAQTLGSPDSTDLTNRVRVTTGAGDEGTSIATFKSEALFDQECFADFLNQTDHLPCGNARAHQRGVVSAVLLLPDDTPISLVTIAPPIAETVATVDRTVSPSSTLCGLEGCVAAKVTRSLGAVRIGAVPTAEEWLVQVDNLADEVSASAGEGAGPPAATTSGTVTWGGGTIDLAAPPTDPVPLPAHTFSSGIYQVTMDQGSFTTRGSSTVATPDCPDRCQRTDTSAISGSPLRASFSVLVTTLATDGTLITVADLTVDIDLGRTVAQATYERAPGVM